MPIILEDAGVEHLAAELACRTGETIAEAIKVALYQRLQLLNSQQSEIGIREKADKILKRVDALPTEDHRSEDEILGYDSIGLPR
ncbi:MAG TPA: type II toxin-antitoxin system VapB family antitoxin [Candidatus Angelobacter sp.]|jgi:antitoxin VapB|nr:type II toxin-antitoxin system VapB family antitoxin [Candidatus Angelobacter sp.]